MRDPTLNLPSSELPLEPAYQDFRSSMHWRIFRIMAELMDGWQFLADFRNTVAVFGSATIPPEHAFYQEAKKLGRNLAEKGFSIVTEGGPGIMQAANEGAASATATERGQSLGLNVKIGHYTRANPFVRKSLGFHYFFVRSLMMSYSAKAYVYFPGGLGTLDHLTAMVTLVQTKKVAVNVPIILIGKEFWQPAITWIQKTVYEKYQAIDQEDMSTYTVVDTADEALRIIETAPMREEFYLKD